MRYFKSCGCVQYLREKGAKVDKPCDLLKRGILPHRIFRVYQRHVITFTVHYSNKENMPHCGTEKLYYGEEQIHFSYFL